MGRNSVHLPTRTLFSWSSSALSKGSEGQLEGSEGLPEGSEGLPEGSDRRARGGRTYGRMDGRNFSPFYRTFSPVGAAAQKGARVLKNHWPKGP